MSNQHPQQRYAALRLPAFAGGTVRVDPEAGIIRNAAVITAGDAAGHGFVIDALTLSQVANAINGAGAGRGVPVRFGHPELAEAGEPVPETLGTDVGYLRDALCPLAWAIELLACGEYLS